MKLLVILILITACSSLRNEPVNSNDFVLNENNSAKPIDFNNR
jgi:uncharacterized protein YcfL